MLLAGTSLRTAAALADSEARCAVARRTISPLNSRYVIAQNPVSGCGALHGDEYHRPAGIAVRCAPVRGCQPVRLDRGSRRLPASIAWHACQTAARTHRRVKLPEGGTVHGRLTSVLAEGGQQAGLTTCSRGGFHLPVPDPGTGLSTGLAGPQTLPRDITRHHHLRRSRRTDWRLARYGTPQVVALASANKVVHGSAGPRIIFLGAGIHSSICRPAPGIRRRTTAPVAASTRCG